MRNIGWVFFMVPFLLFVLMLIQLFCAEYTEKQCALYKTHFEWVPMGKTMQIMQVDECVLYKK